MVISITAEFTVWEQGPDQQDFPGDSESKESACSAEDPGLIPELGRSPGEGIRYALQYSCLGNPMDRGAWQVTVHGVAKESDTTEQLIDLCMVLNLSW